jgi:hypothetical protein
MRLPTSTATKIQAAVCAGEALVCLRLGAAVSRAHSRRQDVHTDAADPSAGTNPQRDPGAAAGLAVFTYELLDAHSDTSLLADGLEDDRHWAAHLDYLRALQRKGQETLAHTARSFDVR